MQGRLKRINEWMAIRSFYVIIAIMLAPGVVLGLLGISSGIRSTSWWPQRMASLGGWSVGWSIIPAVMLLYALQSWLIRKVDGTHAGEHIDETKGGVLRSVVALCMSLVMGIYVAGVLVGIRLLDGLRVPEEQFGHHMYPWWLLAVFAACFVGLTIANCWHAYRSREPMKLGVQSPRERQSVLESKE